MQKKVILHIGHGKTATTSIQSTLKQNRSTLLDNGYFYLLSDGSDNHNQLFVTIFKNNFDALEDLTFKMNIDLKSIDKLRRYYSKWFGNKLQKSDASTIVISGEYFPNFTEEELNSIKQYFFKYLGEVDFEVLFYSRDPVSYASSAYQQQLRKRLINNHKFCFKYKKKITRYINVFGRASVNAYKFEDACNYPGGPTCFFLKKIGLSEDVTRKMIICKTNESMSDLAVDVLSYINEKIPCTEENMKSGLRSGYEHALLLRLPGRKFRLPLDYAKDVLANTKTEMEWLEKNFNIVYENREQDQIISGLLFGDDYVESMFAVLKKASPVLRKLVYEHINEKIRDEYICTDSIRNLQRIKRHITRRYPISVRSPYKVLSIPTRMAFPLMKALRKSRSIRWLRARLKERVNQKKLELIESSK